MIRHPADVLVPERYGSCSLGAAVGAEAKRLSARHREAREERQCSRNSTGVSLRVGRRGEKLVSGGASGPVHPSSSLFFAIASSSKTCLPLPLYRDIKLCFCEIYFMGCICFTLVGCEHIPELFFNKFSSTYNTMKTNFVLQLVQMLGDKV